MDQTSPATIGRSESVLLTDTENERYLLFCAMKGRPDALQGARLAFSTHKQLGALIDSLRLPVGDDGSIVVVNAAKKPVIKELVRDILCDPVWSANFPTDGTIESAKARVNEIAVRRELREVLIEGVDAVESGGDHLGYAMGLPVRVSRAMEGQASNLPVGKSFFDLMDSPPEDGDTLLGNRYLCRRGAMLFIGPSGIGKSSASMQQDALWALGREAFGIKPPRPLRILTIQSENDDGDLHEMAKGTWRGVIDGVTLAEAEMLRENLTYQTVVSETGDKFIALLRRFLTARQYDFVRIDPFHAFFGGKIEDTEQLSNFCRAGINPVLHEFDIGAAINHHTPKITSRGDTSQWSAVDFAYSGAGGAELTNWARAILVVNPTATQGTFKFIAAKRGGRIGWCDDHGEKEIMRFYRHTKQEGGMHWEPGDEEQVEQDEVLKKTAHKKGVDPFPLIEEIVPLSRPIEKEELKRLLNAKGVGKNSINPAITQLLNADAPRFFEHKEKRSRTYPRILIARFPQEVAVEA
jgi:hypothetical protein